MKLWSPFWLTMACGTYIASARCIMYYFCICSLWWWCSWDLMIHQQTGFKLLLLHSMDISGNLHLMSVVLLFRLWLLLSQKSWNSRSKLKLCCYKFMLLQTCPINVAVVYLTVTYQVIWCFCLLIFGSFITNRFFRALILFFSDWKGIRSASTCFTYPWTFSFW